MCLIQLALCIRIAPELRTAVLPRVHVLLPLIRMGSWMTVSNVRQPDHVQPGSFLIGSMLSVSLAAYYVVPCEVITRLLVVPVAVVAVLFPAFSATFASDPKRAAAMFGGSVKYVFVMFFPLLLVVSIFAREGLGSGWARRSPPMVSGAAVARGWRAFRWSSPDTAHNGSGRWPRRPGCQAAPIGIALIPCAAYLLIHRHGALGAAMAWTARAAFDAAGLFAISAWLLDRNRPAFRTGALIAGGVAFLALDAAAIHLPAKSFWLLAGLSYVAFAARFFGIRPWASLLWIAAPQSHKSVKL